MPRSIRRWKQFAESRYAHEREALEFLREVLPDREPIYLYSNFEFIADDGSVNGIDALAVIHAGAGTCRGTWRSGCDRFRAEPDRLRLCMEGCLELSDTVARECASVLPHLPRHRSAGADPRITAGSQCQELGFPPEEVRAWQPPQKASKGSKGKDKLRTRGAGQ